MIQSSQGTDQIQIFFLNRLNRKQFSSKLLWQERRSFSLAVFLDTNVEIWTKWHRHLQPRNDI